MTGKTLFVLRAIALSLQDTAARTSPTVAIPKASTVDASGFRASNRTTEETSKSDNPVLSAFLSERAQLEKDRRERQKRLRSQAGLHDSESESQVRPTKRQHFSSSIRAHTDSTPLDFRSSTTVSSDSARHSPALVPISDEEELFLEGELRQTATQHAEPRKDGRPTFRLTQILGKRSELTFAILSSYSLDWAWIYQFFDPAVPVIMVAQPDQTGEATLKYVFPNWIRATARLPMGRGCMHMKFMLLFYKTGRLRIVISTANLIAYDWRDMENTVWLQDIPLRSSPIPHDASVTEDFPSILQRVLYSINVRPALATMLKDSDLNLPIKSIDDLRMRWEWSKVKVHLVPSIAGKHEGWPNVVMTGHTRLMKAIRNMGLRTGKGRTIVLECQGSSLGYYTTQWMNEFHWSARGESAEEWLDRPKRRREKQPYPPIKIIFPTKKLVQESALGEPGGGTIFCRRRQWAAKNFPRDKFFESKSKAGPVLMHSKMIIALMRENSIISSEESDTADDEIQVIESAVGWAYVGSHNFTSSAWGTLSGSAFNPILNISNYEIGVIFSLRDAQEIDPVACWERPPRKYGSRDEPWIQGESPYHQATEE